MAREEGDIVKMKLDGRSGMFFGIPDSHPDLSEIRYSDARGEYHTMCVFEFELERKKE